VFSHGPSEEQDAAKATEWPAEVKLAEFVKDFNRLKMKKRIIVTFER
jgi:hypothetical protein